MTATSVPPETEPWFGVTWRTSALAPNVNIAGSWLRTTPFNAMLSKATPGAWRGDTHSTADTFSQTAGTELSCPPNMHDKLAALGTSRTNKTTRLPQVSGPDCGRICAIVRASMYLYCTCTGGIWFKVLPPESHNGTA